MAELRPEDVNIAKASGQVIMSLMIDGKPRRLEMSARDAVRLSNSIGNAAVDLLGEPDGLPSVDEVLLKPFDAHGNAALRLSTSAGPLILALNHYWLGALAKAANAALEFGNSAGTA